MEGVCWPLVNGAVSTTATSKACLAASVISHDPKAAASVEAEKKWGDNYVKHFVAHVTASSGWLQGS